MNKKGFTLVELLVTIIILSLVTLIGSVGINGTKKAINKNLWNSNIELIEAAAESFGNDKKIYIKNSEKTCQIDGKTKSSCLSVTVQTLIDRGYLATKDKIKYKDDDNYKVVVNKTIDKAVNEEENFENGYYVNEYKVYIYVENDIVYAKYSGVK